MAEYSRNSSGMDLSNRLIVKVTFGDEIRKFPITSEDITYDDLLLAIQRVFKEKLTISDDITIKYTDEDGDMITIADNSDLAFAVQCHRILKLTLFVNGHPRPVDAEEFKHIESSLRQIRDSITQFLDQLKPKVMSVASSGLDVNNEKTTRENVQLAGLISSAAERSTINTIADIRDFDPFSFSAISLTQESLNRGQSGGQASSMNIAESCPNISCSVNPKTYGRGEQSQSEQDTSDDDILTLQPSAQQVNADHPTGAVLYEPEPLPPHPPILQHSGLPSPLSPCIIPRMSPPDIDQSSTLDAALDSRLPGAQVQHQQRGNVFASPPTPGAKQPTKQQHQPFDKGPASPPEQSTNKQQQPSQQHTHSLVQPQPPVPADDGSLISAVPKGNESNIQAVPEGDASNTIDVNVDYRLHVVSKGNGRNDPCERSIDLTSCRANLMGCKLSYVDSPSLFWIHVHTSDVDRIENELNDPDTEITVLSRPKVGDYCAAPSENDEYLYRAKILEIKNNASGTPFAKLLYIDTGIVDWVAVVALLELPSRLRHYPRQACPCVLANVEPVTGKWTRNVIDSFWNLCQVNENYQLAVKSLDSNNSPVEINTVLLYRIKNNDRENPEGLLIPFIISSKGQLRRVENSVPMKFFEVEGEESMEGNNPPDVNEGWRCTVRKLELEELLNNEDGEVAQASRDTSRAALRAKFEKLETSMPVVQGHIRQGSLLNILESDGSLYFQMTSAVSPSEFYIQLRDPSGRNDALEQLTKDMNSFYSIAANRVILNQLVQQAGAVRWTINDETAYRRILIKDWQFPPDASIRDIRTASTVRVIFVDYGLSERLPTKDVHMLDRRFCALPAQSAYCSLFECRPCSSDGSWDRNACDIFKNLCMSKKYLMLATVMTEKQPYELIVTRVEDKVCINASMCETNLARSEVQWN